MLRRFCAYFDSAFLPRGVALYRSLERHCPSFRLWTLCLDPACRAALSRLRLEHMSLITLEELERWDPGLARAREDRTLMEYYLTCTPCLPLFVLDRDPEADGITYLDSDLYFFSDPAPLFEEMGERSIGIIEHRFPPFLWPLGWWRTWVRMRGAYNDGWVSFRRGPEALACLRWWRERCIEWCRNRSEEGRYTEQKYLDDWPGRFPGVAVLKHKGANVAPWNAMNYKFRAEGDRAWVDGEPLLFYHFSGLRQLGPGLCALGSPQGKLPRALIRIYSIYLRALYEACREVSAVFPRATLRTAGRSIDHSRLSLRDRAGKLWRWLTRGQLVFCVDGRVLSYRLWLDGRRAPPSASA